MRFVTLFGLLVIANAIDPLVMSGDSIKTFGYILLVCFLADVYDFFRGKE